MMIYGTYIVGITGKAGSGKDTLAKMVMEGNEHRMVTMSFAKKLRDVAEVLFGCRMETQAEKAAIYGGCMKTGREILQAIGEGMRKIDENVWVDAVFDQIAVYASKANVKNSPVVILTDVRYPNEAALCNLVVRILRDKVLLEGDAAKHASETEMDKIKPDLIIENTGTLDDLRKAAESLKERLLPEFI